MVAKASLPQIVNLDRDTDQGLMRVRAMKEAIKQATGVKMGHNRSYGIRDKVLEYLHENNDAVLKELRRKKDQEIVAQG